MDSQAINFGQVLNITNQPLPTHGGATVGAILEDGNLNLFMDVNKLITPLSFVKEKLSSKGVFLGCGMDFAVCMDQPEGCSLLKDAIQDLITQGILQFNRVVIETKVSKDEVDVITIPVKAKTTQVPVTILIPITKPPITITVPEPIPYERNQAIPWYYGGECYQQGQKLVTQRSEKS